MCTRTGCTVLEAAWLKIPLSLSALIYVHFTAFSCQGCPVVFQQAWASLGELQSQVFVFNTASRLHVLRKRSADQHDQSLQLTPGSGVKCVANIFLLSWEFCCVAVWERQSWTWRDALMSKKCVLTEDVRLFKKWNWTYCKSLSTKHLQDFWHLSCQITRRILSWNEKEKLQLAILEIFIANRHRSIKRAFEFRCSLSFLQMASTIKDCFIIKVLNVNVNDEYWVLLQKIYACSLLAVSQVPES